MLGMEDVWISIAWWGTVLSAIGCIIYGLFTWNKGEDTE